MRRLLFLLLVLASLSAVGCRATGTYPLDIFPEMHYSQAYRVQEPDRPSVPPSAVPYPYQPEVSVSGQAVYQANCAMCHGQGGKGDGQVLRIMVEKYGYQPVMDPDLTSPQVQGLSDDALLTIIRGGVRAMPAFDRLLTEEEMRAVVQFIRTLR